MASLAGSYAPLFETPRYYNVLLLAWLHASREQKSGAARPAAGGAVISG
jgi:hypothetical protein